ncbi:hypothetical protein J6P52_01450 [bacterium]|nr:hypothetical protein [bacterium]
MIQYEGINLTNKDGSTFTLSGFETTSSSNIGKSNTPTINSQIANKLSSLLSQYINVQY